MSTAAIVAVILAICGTIYSNTVGRHRYTPASTLQEGRPLALLLWLLWQGGVYFLMWWAALSLLVFIGSALAGQIGAEDRQTLAEYQTANGLSDAQMRERFGAVLKIKCGPDKPATGFLLDGGRVVSAEHVPFGTGLGDQFLPRCTAQSIFDGQVYSFDPDAIARGSRFRASVADTKERDLFIGRLTVVPDIVPLRLGRLPSIGSTVTTAFARMAGFHSGERAGIGACKLLASRPRAILTDCDMDKGGSGSPVLNKAGEVVAVTSRATDASAYHLRITQSEIDQIPPRIRPASSSE